MPDHLTSSASSPRSGSPSPTRCRNESSALLWVASGLLVVHWLGDSLDGTLARVRGIERPRYGYYLDHLVDAVATACIGIGLGLSAHMLLITGAIVVVAYLVLSINTYLETQALGTFNLGYGLVGPTEIRLLLVALNTALVLGRRRRTYVPAGSGCSTSRASASSRRCWSRWRCAAARNLRRARRARASERGVVERADLVAVGLGRGELELRPPGRGVRARVELRVGHAELAQPRRAGQRADPGATALGWPPSAAARSAGAAGCGARAREGVRQQDRVGGPVRRCRRAGPSVWLSTWCRPYQAESIA